LIVNLQIQEPVGYVQRQHNIQTQITTAIKKTYIKQTTNTQKQNIKWAKQNQHGSKINIKCWGKSL